MAKVTIVIGERIEVGAAYLSNTFLSKVSPTRLYIFPEVSNGYPIHARRLADKIAILAEVAQSEDSYIITHSSQIVNKFGEMIEEGTFKPEDVVVWMFDGNDFTAWREKPDHIYTFDEHGVLRDWQFGWFEA